MDFTGSSNFINNFMNNNYQNINNNNNDFNKIKQNIINQIMINQMKFPILGNNNCNNFMNLDNTTNNCYTMLNNNSNNIMNFNMMNNNYNTMINNNCNNMINNNMQINNMNLNNINENNLNDDNINLDVLDKTKKELLNKIIKFYHDNNNDNMNFDNKIQIKSLLNNLDPNYQGYHLQDIIEDPLPYVKETKKIIKLVNSNYYIFKVKIPNSITKLEFYSIAMQYKALRESKFLLIHNNLILKEDESSINEIKDEDFVFIIENRNYPDDSYYNFLKKKYKKDDIICARFLTESGGICNILLSVNASIREMLDAFNLKNGLHHMNCSFLYNGKKISSNDERKIGKFFLNNCPIITCMLIGEGSSNIISLGKKIIGTTSINGNIYKIIIGTLDSIKILINYFNSHKINIKKIYLGKTEINNDNDNSLSSFGIKEDFNFLLEYKSNEDNHK